MGLFAAIVIFIALLIIFSIVIIVAILVVNRGRLNNPYNNCNSNSDCLLGYTCVKEGNNIGICKGTSGTFCSSTSQCAPNLTCSFTGGTGVCMTPVPPPVTNNVKAYTIGARSTNIRRLPMTQQPKIEPKQPDPPPDNMAQITVPSVPVAKRQMRRAIVELPSSTDNEINSEGRTFNGPFDMRSQPSSSTSDISSSPRYSYHDSVSTPCEEREGIYYCRNNNNDEMGQEISAIEHSAVIDVCSYSSATIFLLANNTVICANEHGRWRATNNIKILRIVTYNGYIYGLADSKCLYKLPGDCFTKSEWTWNVVDWAPYNILHICTTLDSKGLWIQCHENEEKGFLHSAAGVSFHDTKGIKRIYGRDVDHYLDINTSDHTGLLYPGAIKVSNVFDAALTYYNDVMAIAPNERQQYRSIVIVDWKPYYIRR